MKCLHKLNQIGRNIVFGRSKHYFKYIISMLCIWVGPQDPGTCGASGLCDSRLNRRNCITCFLCNVMQRECWMLCTLYKGRRTETPCNKDDYFHRQLSAAKQISSHNVNFASYILITTVRLTTAEVVHHPHVCRVHKLQYILYFCSHLFPLI